MFVKTWVIQPRDPAVFRDGRPFDRVPGARALSVSFPFPSTVAGAIRTLDGLGPDGRFNPAVVPRLKKVKVFGPLLVRMRMDGDLDWYAPAPADARFFECESCSEKIVIRPSVPLELPEGVTTNLPQGLAPVGLAEADLRKPPKKVPRYWFWNLLERWLLGPEEIEGLPERIGIEGPVPEQRIHVGISYSTRTADREAGALFHTRGLRFSVAPERHLASAYDLALAVATDAPNLRPGLCTIGGERRLSYFEPVEKEFPAIPEGLADTVTRQSHCRLVLLTPAFFEKGWKPSWLLSGSFGVNVEICAVALPKPHVVSGWDLDAKRPKPTRRLVPAGTVYFLKLAGEPSDIRSWVSGIWLRNISDCEQDRLDGFGLAVVGVWDGKVHRMEV